MTARDGWPTDGRWRRDGGWRQPERYACRRPGEHPDPLRALFGLTPRSSRLRMWPMADANVDVGNVDDPAGSELTHLFDEESNEPETVLSLTEAEQLRLWIALNAGGGDG